ncbi:putative flippase GtrA [Hoeflea marina]|uniref:Putative flippase GtrA n=1 Tax=Hoeflea marina TaxID=274592 RepID=A0A317PMC4_9HYPH|nr:GtrA family protein [Hoeflea marina]PWW00197.1 putative flippase GtrA [Hoeflea marina]
MKKLLFFAMAGGVGFIADVAVLFLALRYTPLDPFTGRALGIASAMACTWMINRTFTFAASGRSLVSEGARYSGVGVTSALINFGAYSTALLSLPQLSPYIALTLGSAMGTIFAYLGYSHFVFGKH